MAAKKIIDNKEYPLSAFRFNPNTNRLLNAICEKTKRSRTKMMEYLIEKEAEAQGIPLTESGKQ